MAIMVGAGRGASAGVLFRDAEALETLRLVDTLVVDKTGTLTEGKPKLVTVEPAQGFDADELLAIAAESGAKQRASAGGGGGARRRGARKVAASAT